MIPVESQSIFKCPHCGKGLSATSCSHCGRIPSEVSEGIPVLIKRDLNAWSNEKRASVQAQWYSEKQESQLTGPYRHHIKKRKQLVENILDGIGKQLPKPTVGLDLGCGDGMHLKVLQEKVEHLYATDYNPDRLVRAAQISNDANFFLADVTRLPVLDSVFDLIFCHHVLEHIPNDRVALQEMFRVLKPGGFLVLGVPNEGAAFWKLAYFLQPKVRRTTDHVHFYTAKTLAERCRRVGFSVLQTYPIGYGVPHWSLDARLRNFAWVDDALESVGERYVPSQATSLYLVAEKKVDG